MEKQGGSKVDIKNHGLGITKERKGGDNWVSEVRGGICWRDGD